MKLSTSIILILLFVVTIPIFAQTDDARYLIKQNGKYGYINRNGTLIIAAKYVSAFDFVDGMAWVEATPDRCEIINAQGKSVAEVSPHMVPNQISEGLMAVCSDADQQHGFMDLQGNIAIPRRFAMAENFSEGLAAVSVKTNDDEMVGWVDNTGKFVIAPQYADGGEFKDGLAVVTQNSKSGYINKSGEIIVPTIHKIALPFSEGLGLVFDGPKHQYLDKAGKVVIDLPPLSTAYPFQEGVAAVKIGDVAGFIDKSGQVIIKGDYESVAPFSEGLACVKINGKWGFINKTGKIVIDSRFDLPVAFEKQRRIPQFHGGLALMPEGTKTGYIDTTGAWVWPPSE